MGLSATAVAVLALSLVVGISLGVLGGGGSILMVPILVYVGGMGAHDAIAASLFVVGVTSASGAISHARAGRVRWRTGLTFGAAGLVGAFFGGKLGGHLPGDLLLVAFAVMMVAASVAMIRGRRVDETRQRTEVPVPRTLVTGLLVGLVASIVGAGGGFLVVPALALLGGLPMAVAVGTSLLVIAMNSLGGFAGYLTSVDLDWGLVIAVTVTAVVGSVVGGRLAGRIPEDALRRGFGWFVLAMGGLVLLEQAPSGWVAPIATVAAVIALAATLCWAFVSSCPLRRSRTTQRIPAAVG